MIRGPQVPLGRGEFVSLQAVLISLIALSIDAMLPALPAIGAELRAPNANDTQLVVSALFFGFSIGQILFGPLSDSIGRKRAVYGGLLIFIVGDIVSLLSTDFSTMLIGRALQGFGVAAPRIVSIALVRDLFKGREMARTMSLIMMIFITVPALAPAVGQAILHILPWRYIFGFILIIAISGLLWFAGRQPETLSIENRVPFSFRQILDSVKETVRNRTAFGYTIASGLIFGAFVGYLSSTQQIFQVQFALGDQFPLYFGILALAIGAASFCNSQLVVRYGMRSLSWRALQVVTVVSVVFFLVALRLHGVPPLWAFMAWGLISFFSIGILFGNFNAMAMEPMGHIAGTAAAVIGSLTTAISLVFGVSIGQMYSGTVLPLVGGFGVMGIAAMAVFHWVGRHETRS